jgi:signal transduction histidine kinase
MITASRNNGHIHAPVPMELLGRGDRGATLPAIQASRRGHLAASFALLTRANQPRLDRDLAWTLVLLGFALSVFLPSLRLTVGSHSDRVALGTATTLIGLLVAVMFLARFWLLGHFRALLIGCALAAIAISSLLSQVLLANHILPLGHSGIWVGLAGRLVGWLLITFAALIPEGALMHDDWRLILRERSSRRSGRAPESPRAAVGHPRSASGPIKAIRGLVIVSFALVTVGVGAYVATVDPVSHGSIKDPAAVLGVQIAIALLASVAAWAFLREKRHNQSPAVRLLALAALFGAAASIAYCSSPTISTAAHLGMGDVLRLCSVVVLALSVGVEWYLTERQLRAGALVQERHRIAADVHDLIMQDLSLALASARSLAEDPVRAPEAVTIVAAGERALAGAREVVVGLSERPGKPIAEAVRSAALAAARHARLSFDAENVSREAHLDEQTRDSLVHIAREAVTNATKHAHAAEVEVVLEHADEWRLTVRDAGRGFDPEGKRDERAPREGGMGFGLESMRQRAEALGGSLRVSSAPGRGTTVEAVVP